MCLPMTMMTMTQLRYVLLFDVRKWHGMLCRSVLFLNVVVDLSLVLFAFPWASFLNSHFNVFALSYFIRIYINIYPSLSSSIWLCILMQIKARVEAEILKSAEMAKKKAEVCLSSGHSQIRSLYFIIQPIQSDASQVSLPLLEFPSVVSSCVYPCYVPSFSAQQLIKSVMSEDSSIFQYDEVWVTLDHFVVVVGSEHPFLVSLLILSPFVERDSWRHKLILISTNHIVLLIFLPFITYFPSFTWSSFCSSLQVYTNIQQSRQENILRCRFVWKHNVVE